MLTKDTIDRFYRDVELLGLKRPVAVIADKTGYAKGNISSILNKKLQPSENFIEKFYKSFNTELSPTSKAGRNDNHTVLPLGDTKITLQDYIDLLHRENDRLFTILNSTLGQIHNDQKVQLAYQKAWVEYEAEKSAGGSKQKKQEIMYKMGKLVHDKLGGTQATGTPGETDR